MVDQFIAANGKDVVTVFTNADGDIVLDGLGGLDKLVAQMGATYKLSYGSYKRGTIQFQNGTTRHWTFTK